MKLLVVEDDPRAAKAVTRGLQEHGFLVQTALAGPAGWQWLDRNPLTC